MNHVRFMFNRIKDYSLLYEDVEEDVAEWPDVFTSRTTVKKDHVKDYCQSILHDTVSKFQETMTLTYKGCLERLANEVYTLDYNSNIYTITLTVDTFYDKDAQIYVDILPQYNYEGIEKCYDRLLEKLKIEIKNRLISDWKNCIWLVDEQSEYLCAELYPEFFRIENKIRAFASRVLIQNIGVDWLKCFGLERYRDSITEMARNFQQRVPEFEDINADLLSLTLESLFKIIFEGVIYKEETILRPSDFKTLEGIIKSGKTDNVQNYLLKKREVSANIWDDVFKQYFKEPDRFKSDVTKFINSRNHIAHNKLISWNAYNVILDELDNIDEDLDIAENKFENSEPSKELELTRDALAEQEYDEREFWRLRIADETGVEILDEDEIFDKFCESLNDFYHEILKHFQYDPCFDIGEFEDPILNADTVIFSISSAAVEEAQVDIHVSMIIDDEMQEDSYMFVVCKNGEQELFKATVHYANGSGSEDEDYSVHADFDSVYEDEQMDEFRDQLIDYVEMKLNPLLTQLNGLEHEAVKEGGAMPVADFPCEECGKYGVSIMDSFYPVGKCCYCGFENEVTICSLCGTVFNDLGGKGDICNACRIKDDE